MWLLLQKQARFGKETPVILTDAPKAIALPRKLSRKARQVQLIEATIETLAARGFARMTMSDVAKCAGLSHGLVNFHFHTKENLLAETLRYLSNEYRENWQTALAGAGPSAQAQLNALILADFNPEICTPERLAAWCSFWGEAQSRPLYQQECDGNDLAYRLQLQKICAVLVAEGGYCLHIERVARALRLTIDGVWLDLMMANAAYDRAEALATVYTLAASFFPKHFGADGPLS